MYFKHIIFTLSIFLVSFKCHIVKYFILFMISSSRLQMGKGTKIKAIPDIKTENMTLQNI